MINRHFQTYLTINAEGWKGSLPKKHEIESFLQHIKYFKGIQLK